MLSLSLKILPTIPNSSANTLTAIYYPENISGNDFLSEVSKNDIILAGGLLPSLKTQYFKVGHMGCVNNNDLLATIGAIESSLFTCNYSFETGIGIKTILTILNK